MTDFVFPYASLLKIRRQTRDQCRQQLAEALAAEARLVAEREHIERESRLQQDQIAEMTRQRQLDVDGIARRTWHTGQLARDLMSLAADGQQILREIQQRRQALIEADRQVQLLEKLEEKQRAAHETARHRREARTMEDAWLASHAREVSS